MEGYYGSEVPSEGIQYGFSAALRCTNEPQPAHTRGDVATPRKTRGGGGDGQTGIL